MTKPTGRKVKQYLKPEAAAAPPAGLLEKIKEGIPNSIPLHFHGEGEPPSGFSFIKVAAVLILIASGILTGMLIGKAFFKKSHVPFPDSSTHLSRSPGYRPSFPVAGVLESLPFLKADLNPKSTMDLDVRPASFEVVKNHLEQGHFPPDNLVDTDAFLNAFQPGAPPPSNGDFAVWTESAISPFSHDPSCRILKLNIRAREMEPSERKPTVLTFVVNASDENRLDLLKSSIQDLSGEFLPDDRFALVASGHAGRVILEPTRDRDLVFKTIEQLIEVREDDTIQTVELGLEAANLWKQKGMQNRVLVIDSLENGISGNHRIIKKIIKHSSGDSSSGNSFPEGVSMMFVDDQTLLNDFPVGSAEVRKEPVFTDQIREMLHSVATDTKVEIEFNREAVDAYRRLGDDRGREDRRQYAIRKGGEFRAGKTVTALYEVRMKPGAASGKPVATLKLQYVPTAMADRENSFQTIEFPIYPSIDGQPSPDLEFASLVMEYAQLLRNLEHAHPEDLEAILNRSKSISSMVSSKGDMDEFISLVETSTQLKKQLRTAEWERDASNRK